MRLILVFVAALAIGLQTVGQQNAMVKEYNQAFTTYPFSDPNPIPLNNAVYPYFRYDGFTDKPVNKEWKVVELSNDFISLIILPEIGGKIWAATNKRTQQPFIYYNHAVKFRDVAMRGPWTSGGLESNYGIIGHTPNCATPVDYSTRTNEDGSVSCIVGVLDLVSRSNWRVEINLPKDKAYFTTRSFWYNSTALPQPYYHWMNLGLKAKGNLEFVFPGTHYIGHNGEYADWPVNTTNGKHLNFYEQNDFGGYKSYHVTGKLANFWGAYYHDDDNGMVRFGNYDDKMGRKIWIWGLSRQGMIWEKMLTDTDGQYVELQSGRLFNQNSPQSSYTPFKQVNFAPYATDTWTEYWYPIGKTEGIAMANQWGAFNSIYKNGQLKLYFSAVQTINDTLTVMHKGRKLYSKIIQLSPLQTFTDSVAVADDPGNCLITLGSDKLLYNTDPAADVLSRPLQPLSSFDWTSAQGLYTEAQQLFDQKRFAQAQEKVQASLQKEPGYFPALLLQAIIYYRNMAYTQAYDMLLKCLQVDAHDGMANYYYGLVSAQLGKTTDAIDGFSAASLTQEYKSAAYTGLARIFAQRGLYEKTIGYANHAVVYNAYNVDAWMLKTTAYRKLGQTEQADAAINHILTLDPLNHFAQYEKSLLHPTAENKNAFATAFKNELPQESYAELAIWYYQAGEYGTCAALFKLSPTSAEAAFWLAYLSNQRVDCSSINPFLSFPSRPETGKVLEQLLGAQNDWLLKYQLALLYRDKNRIDDAKKLLQECGDAPTYAPFYVVRAEMFSDNAAQVLTDLQKATALDPLQWRYQKLLAEYYLTHQQPEKALAIAKAYHHTHPADYIMGMLYAKTLMQTKQFTRADKLLSTLNIIPFEGATDGRLLYREAKLMQAVAAIKAKKYKPAANFIRQAREWPENLGVGKPYDADIDTRLEDWMAFLALKEKNNASAQSILTNIAAFNPAIDNTVPNFIASNALVSAWAIERLKGKAEAQNWLAQQLKAFPAFEKTLQWAKNAFDKNAGSDDSTVKQDANIRILEALQSL